MKSPALNRKHQLHNYSSIMVTYRPRDNGVYEMVLDLIPNMVEFSHLQLIIERTVGLDLVVLNGPLPCP